MQEIINKQKAPKDILLNSILKEIDEENGITVKEVKPTTSNKTKKTSIKQVKKHPILQIIFYLLFSLIVLFLIFMVLMINKTEEDILAKKIPDTPIPNTVNRAKEIISKAQYHFKDFSKSSLKKEGNNIVGTMQKITHDKDKEPKEFRRQTAKEVLLEQMKN